MNSLKTFARPTASKFAAATTKLLPAKKPAPGLQIGSYHVGDEVCCNLFGHPDIRY